MPYSLYRPTEILMMFEITNNHKMILQETKAKTMAQAILDTWNTRTEEMILLMYAPDYMGEDITGGKLRHGQEGTKLWMRSVFTAFPNIKYELIETLETENQLAMHWRASGNHQGTYLKIPATGKPVTIEGFSMLKLKEGKILWDLASVLRQIGLLPQMP
jgi:steroid delta-isomerase-like uncharacterized protein